MRDEMADSPEHQAAVDRRRKARMEMIDGMPPEVRALVHEYGLNVVYAFLQCGVTKPKQIRHLAETVLDEFSPTRGCSSSQGVRATNNAPLTAR